MITDYQIYQMQIQFYAVIAWSVVIGVLFGLCLYPIFNSFLSGLWRFLDRKNERKWLSTGDIFLCEKCGDYYPVRFSDRHSKFCRSK